MVKRHLVWLALLVVTASAPIWGQEPPDLLGEASADELVVDGIVVTPLGAGVSGAEVRIELPDAAATDQPIGRTTTGPRGQIAIKIARPPVDELRFRVLADGFTEHVGTIDISDPDDFPFIQATLHGASTISGTVTAILGGTPVVGAAIQCQNGGRRLTATTGPDGGYSFDSVYVGPAAITVTAPGFGTQREQVSVEDDSLTLDFALAPEQPIELTIVTNTGQPAADVLVEARSDPLQVYLSAQSDADGKARLSGVDLQSTGLSIRLNGKPYLWMRGYEEYLALPGRGDQEPPPSTQPATVRGRFTVTLAGQIHGKVVDKETGQPIRNVRVLAGHEPRHGMPMDWTGPGGTYELIGVRPGIVTVTFQHDGYATAFHSVDLDTGKTAALDVGMERGVAIAGLVVDEEDSPVDQVRVLADNWKEYRTLGLRAITDSNGRFALPHVPPGEIEFTFVRPADRKRVTVDLEAGKTDHVVTLESVAESPSPESLPIEQAKLAVGQDVPDLKLTATDGTSYQLSELRGKYVFLDCWASWCRPCIGEIPNVKALHEATKDRPDFLLIGISLDTDAKALKKARDEHGMTWPQVFGPKSGASEAFEELDGMGIPYTCLIGPDGKLLAQHLRGRGMVEEVRRLSSARNSEGQEKPVGR
jgi:peroxiredoxin